MLEGDKEVMVKSHRDTAKQLGVDTPLAEDLVDIGAVAIDFLRQPCGGPTLATQFVADERADVDFDATFFGRFE